MYDKVPGMVTAAVVAAAPVLPGPTRDEWVGTASALAALLLREFLWWLRNRKRG